jgi:hypothetical protein
MQKARRHFDCSLLRPLVSVWLQVLFTLLLAVLFTFPSRYLFTIGLSGVFSLTGWYRLIHAKFLWFRTTQDSTVSLRFVVQDFHLLWSGIPSSSVSLVLTTVVLLPHVNCSTWFGLFRFRSPLLAESFPYFLFL